MRRKILRYAVVPAGVLLAAAQFLPVDRTNPAEPSPFSPPPEIASILESSCYDCHSHRSRWPWYAYVAPASWYVTRHVTRARKDLNFSDWPVFDNESQVFFLSNMRRQVEEGNMPLKSYLLLHRHARLSESERETLLQWLRAEVDLLGWGPGSGP